MGNDDGIVSFGVVVGDFVDDSDEASNPGTVAMSGPRSPPPMPTREPASLAVWGFVLGISAVAVRCPQSLSGGENSDRMR